MKIPEKIPCRDCGKNHNNGECKIEMKATWKFWQIARDREEAVIEAMEILGDLLDTSLDCRKPEYGKADRAWVHLNFQYIALSRVTAKARTAVRKNDLEGL